jgi:hypothetical protein
MLLNKQEIEQFKKDYPVMTEKELRNKYKCSKPAIYQKAADLKLIFKGKRLRKKTNEFAYTPAAR